MLVFKLFEGSGLRVVDPLGQQDPYVEIKLDGEYVKRSKVVEGGGKDPYFEEEELAMWVDGNTWMKDVVVTVCDQSLGNSNAIGYTEFSMLPYMDIPPGKAQQEVFELYFKDTRKRAAEEVQQGELVMKVGTPRVCNLL